MINASRRHRTKLPSLFTLAVSFDLRGSLRCPSFTLFSRKAVHSSKHTSNEVSSGIQSPSPGKGAAVACPWSGAMRICVHATRAFAVCEVVTSDDTLPLLVRIAHWTLQARKKSFVDPVHFFEEAQSNRLIPSQMWRHFRQPVHADE